MAPKPNKATTREEEKNVLAISAVEEDDDNLDRLLESITFSQQSDDCCANKSIKSSKSNTSLKSILKRDGDCYPYGHEAKSKSRLFEDRQGIAISPNRKPSFVKEIKTNDSMDASVSSIDTTGFSISSSRRGSISNMRRTNSQVSFKSVEIREYDRTLGDNPACMSGPPISLDWSYSKESEIGMEEYEKIKTMKRRKRKKLLRLGKDSRVDLLQNHLGYSEDEIQAAMKEKNAVQRGRAITNIISPLWRLEDAAQSAGRKIKKSIKKGHKSDGDIRVQRSSTASITLDASNSSSIVHDTSLQF